MRRAERARSSRSFRRLSVPAGPRNRAGPRSRAVRAIGVTAAQTAYPAYNKRNLLVIEVTFGGSRSPSHSLSTPADDRSTYRRSRHAGERRDGQHLPSRSLAGGRRPRVLHGALRSEERRVGTEGVGTCSARWEPDNYKQNTITK